MLWFLLVFPAAALAAMILFLRSPAGRTRRKGLFVTVALAVGLAIVGFALLGIPGAVVYALSLPWVTLFLGETTQDLGDGAWPAAIYTSLFWPASLVVAYTVAAGPLRNRSRWAKAVAWILIPYAAGVALALWAHLSLRAESGPPNRAAAEPATVAAQS
jgi:uncharacterized membrane protein YhaH (DUF805 family)